MSVTDPAGNATSLVALRSDLAAAEQEPVFPVDTVTRVDLDIQVGADGGMVTAGVNLWSPALAD